MERLISKGLYHKIFPLIRILYVSPFDFGVSGADESLLTIVGHIPRSEFEPHVVLPPGSPYADRFAQAGAQVHKMKISRLKRTINPFYWLVWMIRFPFEVMGVFRLIRDLKIDLVHVNMESTLAAGFAARLRKVPLVYHYRGNVSDRPTWFFAPYLRILVGLADHIFVISGAVAQIFFKRGLREGVEVIYNAVDLCRFRETEGGDYFSDRDPRFRRKKAVTYLGRIHPRKRIRDFIDAAAGVHGKDPEVVFAVVGGNPSIGLEQTHEEELRTYLDTLKPRPPVFFFGRDPDIASILNASQLLVIPSLEEGFGRVVIEAMAAGVPVVASESGAFPEVLEGGKYGRLVPPFRPDLLAGAIRESLADPRRTERIEKARAYARSSFDIESHVKRLVERYHKLLSERA